MRVAVYQLNSREDRDHNLVVARDLLERAASASAKFVVLPEYIDYLGLANGACKFEDIGGEFATIFAIAARDFGPWVHAGFFYEAGPDDRRTYNMSLLFSFQGALIAIYCKIHLYDVEIAGGVFYQDFYLVALGDQIVVVDGDGIGTRLSICDALGFSELYCRLAVDGAACVLCSCGLYAPHGLRLLGGSVYVVAVGQIDGYSAFRTCFGRRMIIDLQDTVLAQALDTTGIVTADLDLLRLEEFRRDFLVSPTTASVRPR